ncbi:hypothetical protein P171DRAFT_433636 [Karstenula rhodostoma CBS 690.94]|uniref:Uncharacterized protein n=1 Tax=Karstenula rhodostoma CBS 690.94 TaxID=1392251 RepID=A0A9P4U9C8_9PLEO|nr:hypothetical protein P171DRAFT_433636 [Karstenula rhodostoma CBS 690.94]
MSDHTNLEHHPSPTLLAHLWTSIKFLFTNLCGGRPRQQRNTRPRRRVSDQLLDRREGEQYEEYEEPYLFGDYHDAEIFEPDSSPPAPRFWMR